ncbi:MAG TPA: VOC family protein [Candidatus Limnocylindrales bacterium]|jgi:catechol 2,3-dioxygenase-like lactoylglutathione lyase family enzyme|nr:VOC family protein [Candidatus Limnocylindrales bacterium]
MDYKLELVPIPVADVDRAKAFYSETVGFTVDVDHAPSDAFRIVQLTPPGSACSIMVGKGAIRTAPGSVQGLQLVVDDIEAAHAELTARGLDLSPVRHFVDGEWLDGKGGPWNSFAFFDDPDGNGWALQERPAPADR